MNLQKLKSKQAKESQYQRAVNDPSNNWVFGAL